MAQSGLRETKTGKEKRTALSPPGKDRRRVDVDEVLMRLSDALRHPITVNDTDVH